MTGPGVRVNKSYLKNFVFHNLLSMAKETKSL